VTLLEVLEAYFRSERAVGFVFLGVGLFSLAFAFWTWRTMEGGFGVGLAIPMLLLGLAGSVGGPMFVVRTERQVAELREQSPTKIREVERPRMARVNANWPRFKAAWTALILIALALLWLVKRDFAAGVGLGLILLSGFVFTIDLFAERRAEIYARALEME
jgi:hypothetical protein